MDIEGYTIKSAAARVLSRDNNRAVLSIVIHEGRKRQVRHMCKNVSLLVDRLVRVRIGNLELGDLESGKWKHCDFAGI
jgi:23S rRNA pseudouridine2605 synthase